MALHAISFLVYVVVLGVRSSLAIILLRMREGRTGPKVIKLFSCSTQLGTKFQLLSKTKIQKSKEVS